jgi:uncharacterized protein (UPF0335 family)
MLAKNSLEGKAEEFLKRIETLHDDLETARGVYTQDCKMVREDIRSVYSEAKDKGVPVQALKGLVKHRQLTRKQNALAANFDHHEAAAFATLIAALGELGLAAARAAGHAPREAQP